MLPSSEAQETRRRDYLCIAKVVAHVLLALWDLVSIGLIAALVKKQIDADWGDYTVPAVEVPSWYLVGLVPLCLSFAWCLLFLGRRLVSAVDVRPCWHIAVNLVLLGAVIVVAIFVSANGFNNGYLSVSAKYAPDFISGCLAANPGATKELCLQWTHALAISADIELVIGVFLICIGCLHFSLFIRACIDTHARRSKRNAVEQDPVPSYESSENLVRLRDLAKSNDQRGTMTKSPSLSRFSKTNSLSTAAMAPSLFSTMSPSLYTQAEEEHKDEKFRTSQDKKVRWIVEPA